MRLPGDVAVRRLRVRREPSPPLREPSASASGSAFQLLVWRLAFVVRHDDEQLAIVGLLVVWMMQIFRWLVADAACASRRKRCGHLRRSTGAAGTGATAPVFVPGQIHHSHAAATELGGDVVLSDGPADQRVRRVLTQQSRSLAHRDIIQTFPRRTTGYEGL